MEHKYADRNAPGYLLNAFFVTGVVFCAGACGAGAGRGAFSFPSVRIGSPIFSISALSCASLQPLTPITRKPVAETALCIADQFTGSSSALTLSTTGHVLKMRGPERFCLPAPDG